MTAAPNKHRDFRLSIRLEAYFSEDLYEVVGTLTNISYSGALIEDTSMQPAIGTPCVLYLFLTPPGTFQAVSPFRLTGHVVRHSSNGFAIEYENNFDPDVRRLIDDVAAILAAPR
jgi:hypothetical protein